MITGNIQAMLNEAVPQGVKDILSGFDVYTPTVWRIRQGQENVTVREGDPGALDNRLLIRNCGRTGGNIGTALSGKQLDHRHHQEV